MIVSLFLLIFAFTLNVKANPTLEINELQCSIASHSNLQFLKNKFSSKVNTLLTNTLHSENGASTMNEADSVYWQENLNENLQALPADDFTLLLTTKNCKILESKIPQNVAGYYCAYAIKDKKTLGFLCKFEKTQAPMDKIKIISSFDVESTKQSPPNEDLKSLETTLINQVSPNNQLHISRFIDCTKQFGPQLTNDHLKSYPSLEAIKCAYDLVENHQNNPENVLFNLETIQNDINVPDMCQKVAVRVNDLNADKKTKWSHQGHVSCAVVKSLKQNNRDVTATCCAPVSKYYVSGLLDCSNEFARVNQQILFFSKQVAEESLASLQQTEDIQEGPKSFVTIIEHPDHTSISSEQMCYFLAQRIPDAPQEPNDSQVIGCSYVWNGAQSKVHCLTKRIDEGFPMENKDFNVKAIDCKAQLQQALTSSNAHFAENLSSLIFMYTANSNKKKSEFQSLMHSQDLQRSTNAQLTREHEQPNKPEVLKALPATFEAVVPYFPKITDEQYCIAAVNYWLLQRTIQPYIFKKDVKFACSRITNRLATKIVCDIE